MVPVARLLILVATRLARPFFRRPTTAKRSIVIATTTEAMDPGLAVTAVVQVRVADLAQAAGRARGPVVVPVQNLDRGAIQPTCDWAVTNPTPPFWRPERLLRPSPGIGTARPKSWNTAQHGNHPTWQSLVHSWFTIKPRLQAQACLGRMLGILVASEAKRSNQRSPVV